MGKQGRSSTPAGILVENSSLLQSGTSVGVDDYFCDS